MRYVIAVFLCHFHNHHPFVRFSPLPLYHWVQKRVSSFVASSQYLRGKTLANVTRSRSTEAPNVPWQFPPHYRRICGNGILIERCLLSLNATARVTTGALQTRHDRYILQTNSPRACAHGRACKIGNPIPFATQGINYRMYGVA